MALDLQNWRKENKLLPDKQNKAFDEFYDSARHNDILDPKTALLLHLASAMALACSP